jgi:hypothetical protein
MAVIRLNGFRGKRPYVTTEHLLGISDASDCDDVIFESGLLRGVKDDVVAETADANFASSVSLYRYPDTGDWFTFTVDTDIVTAARTSTDEIILYTDGVNEPRMTNAALIGVGPTIGAYRTVGITAPTAAPSVVVSGSEDADPAIDTRTYVYTWVDDVSGMESAPSPVSNIVTMDEIGQTATVTMSTTAPVDNVTTKRIYRTVTGTSTTEYLYVDEVSLATATYADTLLGSETGEAIITEEFDRPPTDMHGILKHPAGFFVGFSGNTICFSEPGYYYAWPTVYRIELEYPIVGIAAVGGYLAIMTEGVPYIAAGSSPYNMVPRKLDNFYPCVSKRSITDMGGYCVYAADDALVMVSGQGAVPISRGILTRKQWQAKTPTGMFGTRWRGLYLAVYPTYIDVWPPQALEVGISELSVTYKSDFVDPATGDVYMVNSSNEIINFAEDSTTSSTTWSWVSKPIMFNKPVNFACMRALGSFGGTVTIEEDDSAPSTATDAYSYTTPDNALVSNTPIRLPSGIRCKGVRVTINGGAGDELHELHIATSIAELPGTASVSDGNTDR